MAENVTEVLAGAAVLAVAVVKVMQDEEVKKRFAEVGVIATFSKTPQDFKDYIVEDAKKWEAVIKDVNARPD